MARYLLSGAVSAVIYLGLVWVAVTWLRCDVFASGVAGYLVATPVAYSLHRVFTYRSGSPIGAQFPKFLISSLMGLLLAGSLPELFLILGAPLAIALLITCILVPMINFAVLSAWVFVQEPDHG